jgi:hypothetical protein
VHSNAKSGKKSQELQLQGWMAEARRSFLGVLPFHSVHAQLVLPPFIIGTKFLTMSLLSSHFLDVSECLLPAAYYLLHRTTIGRHHCRHTQS